jgi:hypothetical protein
MRGCRILFVLALASAGCGGAGEMRRGDASPPLDAPIDMAGGSGRGGTSGAGGGGSAGGTGGSVTTGAEIGASCAAAADCKSGFCFDAVCCRSDCSGLCQSCAQPGSIGTCMNVPVGADPRDECPDDGVAGCMRDGFCDGTGSCALYARGTICGAQTCAASTVTHAALCDGDGTCGGTTTDSCGQYLCGGDGKCRSTCATNADCVAGAACVNGSCGPKPPGALCSAGGECASTVCAQGVCCKTACAGTCKSCAIAGSEGECINAPSGADPLSQCADQGATTCGTDGTCDGAGACRQYSGATTCADATCTGSTATPSRTCNGAGVCLMALPVSCAPYLCGGGGACRTSCASDADCLAPNVCTGTTCGPPATGGMGGGGGSGGGGGTGGATGSAGTTGAGGAAGTGGGGGAGGTGGAAGTTGAAGGAGTTGAAGASGSAGASGGSDAAAGTTGAAGAAGTTGSAGRGGTTGTGGTAGATGAGARGGTTGTGGTGCAGYAFCDDFEDGDTAGWTPSGGTWSVISDGSKVYQGGNGNSMSLAGPSTWTDQTITARVKVVQWGGTSTSYRAGIVARATDPSNLYVFAIDASGALRLLKGTSSPSGTGASGTCGKVTPAPAAVAGTWYTMQMKVVGTGNNVLITTFLDGVPVHDCQTSVGTLPSGRAGTYIYGPNTIVEFDDVKVLIP